MVVVYYRPDDLEVMDEFLRVVHGFPEVLLVICEPQGGAEEKRAEIQKDARSMGMSILELPNFTQTRQLFAPNRVIKVDLGKVGNFDATEIAADINKGETVMVVFGDSISDIEGEEMYIEQPMGSVGAVAVVLHEIAKFIETKE